MFKSLARNPVLRNLSALVYILCIQAANTIFTSTENLVLMILYQDFTVVCPCVPDSSKFSQISCIVGEPSSPGRQVLVHEYSIFVGTRLQFAALLEDFVSATFALEFHEHGARAICLCRMALHSDSVTPNDIAGLERSRDTNLLVDNVNYCVFFLVVTDDFFNSQVAQILPAGVLLVPIQLVFQVFNFVFKILNLYIFC